METAGGSLVITLFVFHTWEKAVTLH